MHFWKLFISGVLAAVLLVSAVAPVIAAKDSVQDKFSVLFQNKTGGSVRITLTGPATVYLTLNTGKTKYDLTPGIYNYSYFACGKTISGIFKVKSAGATLTLLKCKWDDPTGNSASGKAQVQFENKTGASVRLTLIGPATVYLTLNTGKTRSELTPGTYSYSYSACGKTNTGTFKVKKSGDNLILPKCATGGKSGAEGKIKIVNDTGGTITMYLVGPQNYTFYLAPGTTQLNVVKGKYNFTAYGCGGAVDTGILKPGDHLTFFCY
jgi:hypothetical protein